MHERIVDIDELPERLADALEQTWAWEHADEVTRCGDCKYFDKATETCGGGILDADIWPSDWCCYGVPR